MELTQTQYSHALTKYIEANNTGVLSGFSVQDGNEQGIFHGLVHLHIFWNA